MNTLPNHQQARATVAGLTFQAALLLGLFTVLALATPVNNPLWQGAATSDLNQGGHNITNVGTLQATNLAGAATNQFDTNGAANSALTNAAAIATNQATAAQTAAEAVATNLAAVAQTNAILTASTNTAAAFISATNFAGTNAIAVTRLPVGNASTNVAPGSGSTAYAPASGSTHYDAAGAATAAVNGITNNFPVEYESGSFTALPGQVYCIMAGGSEVDVTVPDSPTQPIYLYDGDGTWAANGGTINTASGWALYVADENNGFEVDHAMNAQGALYNPSLSSYAMLMVTPGFDFEGDSAGAYIGTWAQEIYTAINPKAAASSVSVLLPNVNTITSSGSGSTTYLYTQGNSYRGLQVWIETGSPSSVHYVFNSGALSVGGEVSYTSNTSISSVTFATLAGSISGTAVTSVTAHQVYKWFSPDGSNLIREQ